LVCNLGVGVCKQTRSAMFMAWALVPIGTGDCIFLLAFRISKVSFESNRGSFPDLYRSFLDYTSDSEDKKKQFNAWCWANLDLFIRQDIYLLATVLDSFVGLCIKKVQGIVMEEAISILGVNEELKELQRRMKQIQFFLHDAEQRRIEEHAVNNWLGELKDAIYDADDIIDMAKFEGSKLLANHPSPSSLQIKFISCCDLSVMSCIRNVQTRRKIALQIRRVNCKLQKVSIDKTFLTLENVNTTYRVLAPVKRHTSNLVKPNLVGKEIKYATSRQMLSKVPQGTMHFAPVVVKIKRIRGRIIGYSKHNNLGDCCLPSFSSTSAYTNMQRCSGDAEI
ncbi:hypothetical protein E2562_008567, partial [Oryza meyeriana var. granulata]